MTRATVRAVVPSAGKNLAALLHLQFAVDITRTDNYTILHCDCPNKLAADELVQYLHGKHITAWTR